MRQRKLCGNHLTHARQFFNHSWRFMDAYRQGLTGKAAEWAVWKQKLHWRVRQGAMMSIEAVLNWDYPKHDTLYSKILGPEIVESEKMTSRLKEFEGNQNWIRIQRSGPKQRAQRRSKVSRAGHPQNGGEQDRKVTAASIENRKTLKSRPEPSQQRGSLYYQRQPWSREKRKAHKKWEGKEFTDLQWGQCTCYLCDPETSILLQNNRKWIMNEIKARQQTKLLQKNGAESLKGGQGYSMIVAWHGVV